MPQFKKKPKVDVVKTSIPVGDTSAQEGSDFQADGAGVDAKVKVIGADPNDGVSLGHQVGAE